MTLKMSRQIRPTWLGVEHHDDGILQFDLGVTNRPIGI
jgi:hypothetical protein